LTRGENGRVEEDPQYTEQNVSLNVSSFRITEQGKEVFVQLPKGT